jgi:Mrp family chromosome partitioning ATPase
MTQILQDLNGRADVIVIDTPPCMVADAQVLAGKVDVVLLVVQPGHTHADAAVTTLEAFNRAGARVVGVVLNRIPRNRAYYYGGYRYYYSHYKSHKYYSGDGSRPAREEYVHADEPVPSRSLLARLIHSTAKDGKQEPSLHPDEK